MRNAEYGLQPAVFRSLLLHLKDDLDFNRKIRRDLHANRAARMAIGFAKDGDERSLGTLRSVALPSVGTTGGIMVRVSNGNGGTQGACTGDSGGPAYLQGEVAGVIGWTSIPAGKNCGFTTGVTLVGLQRGWIERTIQTLSITR